MTRQQRLHLGRTERSGNPPKVDMEEKNSRDGSTVADDRCNRGVEIRKLFVLFQIRRIEVLSPMGQETDSGHKQYDIDTTQPIILEHLSDFVDEDACLRFGMFSGFCLPL